MKVYKFTIFAFISLFIFSFKISGQTQKSCTIPQFNNCFGLKQLILRNVSGQVEEYINEKQGREKDFVFVPDACVSLFTTNRKLVASTKTDQNGRFNLKKIPNGSYWLVVRDGYNMLTPAIVEISVVRKTRQNKKFKVHMVILAIDSCSYGELK